MPATDPDLAGALQDARLVDELHAFLWTDPFLDGATPDDGWSARDHAVVLGQLLHDLGAEVRIRHGKCMFVRGPGADGAGAVGIGQQGSSRAGHTWLDVTGLGDVDLSPKLAARRPPWIALESPGVIGSVWIAAEPTRFVLTTKVREYEDAIAAATQAEGGLQAVYLMQREQPFSADIGLAGLSWARSRVSIRLAERGLPDDLYARFAAHLLGLRAGERSPLRGLSQNKAWSILAGDGDLLRRA